MGFNYSGEVILYEIHKASKNVVEVMIFTDWTKEQIYKTLNTMFDDVPHKLICKNESAIVFEIETPTGTMRYCLAKFDLEDLFK